MTYRRPLVHELLPSLAQELTTGLLDADRSDLAQQVPQLVVWGRCGCDDYFCASFYTGPRPKGAWRDEGEHQNVMPDVAKGMVIVDVVAGVIRYVEVLDRPDIKAVISTVDPLSSRDVDETDS